MKKPFRDPKNKKGISTKGISTVEIVIIVAILLGLAFIFKNQIYALLDQIFDRLFKNAGDVTLFTQPPDKTMGNP